jgi:hypothetical protein
MTSTIIKRKLDKVILIGWMGGKQSALQKYVPAWKKADNQLQVNLNVCGGPIEFLTYGVIKDALLVSKQLQNPNERVGIHVFSNRGMLVYLCVRGLLLIRSKQGSRESSQIRSVVFDSCPGNMLPHLFFSAIVAGMSKDTPSYITTALRATPIGIIGILSLFIGIPKTLWLSTFIIAGSYAWSLAYQWICGHLFPCEQSLFIYSESDKLVDYKSVERTLKWRQEAFRGREIVRGKKFIQSEHVAHLVSFPEEYESAIKKVVDDLE